MRKPLSLKTHLLIPTIVSFVVFVAAVVISAYSLYSSNVTNSNNAQMLATSQQILTNYETYFDSVITTSNNIIGKYSSSDVSSPATLESEMKNYFDSIMSLKPEIFDMSIYKVSDGSPIAANSTYEPSLVSDNESWFKSAKSNFLVDVFSSPEQTSDSGSKYSFTLSRYVTHDRDSSYDAVMKIDFDFTKIVDTISPVALGDNGLFTIYDKNYNFIYTSAGSEVDRVTETGLIKRIVVGSGTASMNGHTYFLYATTISNTTWRLAIFISTDSLSKAITSFALYISLIGAGLIIVFAFLMTVLANNVTNPLRKLQTEMADIASLNYTSTLQTDIQGSEEIVELNASFNQMMGRIKELTDSLVAEKEEQRKSELKALQNQINPHFLYNTLDSVIALIDKGENDKAEDMIVALSRFFRISISKGHNVIPLSNEIEHARNYLLIQKMRFGNSFAYDISVEPGLEKYYVVKLILQPIVENSIGHGLKEGEVGHIGIKAYAEGPFIRFDISDNGYGMTSAKVEELMNSLKDNTVYQGVGLKNVYQRIRIYYGEQADVLIHSEEEVGTIISILIPKDKAVDYEE